MLNLKPLVIVFFLSLGILAQCQSSHGQQARINGVSFVASKDTIRQKHIDPVLKLNSNWVSIMPFGFMRNLEANQLYFNNERQWYGERAEGVKQSIAMMHKNGIKVMLKPQIWIGNGEFTGHITMKTEKDWETFETQYKEMLLLYAKIAQETNAEMLCIGTELNSFVAKRPQFWSSLITSIREVYSGHLTYAENWDKMENVSFWSSLDFIGVDAYFPISDAKTPELEAVKLEWQSINSNLEGLSQKNNRPIVFTEFGYRSIDFAGKQPWRSERIEGQINEEAQSVLLQGLMESLWGQDWFAGGFLWKWFHEPEKLSNRQANRFCVHGKLAEEMVRNFYRTN